MSRGIRRIADNLAGVLNVGSLVGYRKELQLALSQNNVFDPDTDCVGKVTLNGNVYEAHVTPFWGTWSTEFLHSTDIVLATAGVLDQVIGAQDKIATVDSVRFHQPLRSGLATYTKILAPEEDASSLLMPAKGKATYTFTASTQNSKKIGMVGYDSQVAVERRRHWDNSNMRTAFSRLYEVGCARHTDLRCSFQMPISPSADQGVNYSNPAYATIVAMDTVMGFRQALEAIGYLPKMGAALAAGFESMDVPPVSFFTTTGGVIDLDVDFEKLKVGKNFAILPIAFEYQYFGGKRCGRGVYKVAIPKSECVVRVTQALTNR